MVPAVLTRLALRGLGNRGYWRRWGERFGFVPRLARAGAIWLHAVSVGETRAAAPLVRALQARYPGRRLLVTTMTPTGSDQVRQLFGDGVDHCYVPYDLPTAVRRFLSRTRPAAALIMETELWPNLFHACRKRGIPVAVANVRMSERSLRRYRRFPRLTRATLEQVDLFAAQTEADAGRMRALGARAQTVQVTGSIKFDIELPPDLATRARALRHAWGEARPVWIAASTHDGEDEPVLAAFAELRRRRPELLLILVPRHPERFGAVARLCRRGTHTVSLRSVGDAALGADTDILVGDTMGELQLLYATADVAFVGGSLVPTGGHNLLEACAVGVPSVFGPHMFNFAEIARLCAERGAGRRIAAAGELADAVAAWLDDPAARAVAGAAGRQLVEENRGALARTLALISARIPA